MTKNKAPIIFLTALIFCGSIFATQKKYSCTQYSRLENMHVWCHNQKDLPTLFYVSKTCSNEVRKWLNVSNLPPTLKINIYLLSPESPILTSDYHSVYLSSTLSPTLLYTTLIKSFLQRYLHELYPDKKNDFLALDWITAGLYHRIYYDGKGFVLYYIPDFRIARNQFKNGHFPELQKLIENPVSPKNDELYKLYAIYCDVFLKTLEQESPKEQERIKSFLEMQCYNRPQMSSLTFLIQTQLKNESLSAWYKKEMFKVSGQGIRKTATQDTTQKLNDIITVSTLSKKNIRDIKYIPFYKIPSKKRTKKFTGTKLIELRKLYLQAPILLQKPIYHFTIALQTKNYWLMKYRYKKAQKEFDKAMEREKYIETRLDHYEETQKGKLNTFQNMLGIIYKYKNIRQDILGKALPYNLEKKNEKHSLKE